MNGALRAMLEGIIDYAGLFPPAKLPMPEAVSEYLDLVQGPNAWLVDRLAVNAARLGELSAELSPRLSQVPFPVAVIGTAAAGHKEWRQAVEQDAEAMTAFQASVAGAAEIQAYEVRLPDHQHLDSYVRDLKQFTNIDLFAELPWGAAMNESLAALAELEIACAKVRTGGLDASAFPSATDLAGFVQQCVQLDLTFKLTAGLHHPLPKDDVDTGARMHGFLNVIIATALAMKEDLSRREIEEVLENTVPKAFAFKRESLVYKDHKVTTEDLENARTLFVSFGSCSVAEPVEDLEKLNLLEKTAR